MNIRFASSIASPAILIARRFYTSSQIDERTQHRQDHSTILRLSSVTMTSSPLAGLFPR
jgi:hypothetical protein